MVKQSAKMKALRSVDGMLRNVVPHSSLNSVKGVVYSRELLGYCFEELTEELVDQELVSVERVSRRSDGVHRPTATFFITIN